MCSVLKLYMNAEGTVKLFLVRYNWKMRMIIIDWAIKNMLPTPLKSIPTTLRLKLTKIKITMTNIMKTHFRKTNFTKLMTCIWREKENIWKTIEANKYLHKWFLSSATEIWLSINILNSHLVVHTCFSRLELNAITLWKLVCGPVWTGVDRCGPAWTGVNRREPAWTGVNRREPAWTGVNRCKPV